jgi:hypothetical protein
MMELTQHSLSLFLKKAVVINSNYHQRLNATMIFDLPQTISVVVTVLVYNSDNSSGGSPTPVLVSSG